VARQTPAGKNAAARSRRADKAFYEVCLVHRIAIKYLYLYLHFKSTLARSCSGLFARYRRLFATCTRISGFFVIDYKSHFLLIALLGDEQSSRLNGRKNMRIFIMIFRIYRRNACDLSPSSARSCSHCCIS